MPWRPRAAILDLDGLLLDTERLSRNAFHAAAKRYSVPATDDLCRQLVGNVDALIDRVVREVCGASNATEAFLNEWERLYTEALLRGTPLMHGAGEFLDTLEWCAVDAVLATSTHAARAARSLTSAGIAGRFDLVVTRDDVQAAKPHPELLRCAAGRAGMTVDDCLAFDDSECGVTAALAAHMRVVFVEDVQPPSAHVRQSAYAVVASLDEASALVMDLCRGSLQRIERDG